MNTIENTNNIETNMNTITKTRESLCLPPNFPQTDVYI